VLQVKGTYENKNSDYSPGFSRDVREDKGKRYRKHISPDVLKVIDQTDCWWPSVKDVRDVVIHREHDRLVFPQLGDGDSLLFQVYQGWAIPIVLVPDSAMYPKRKNVVDFSLYSGFVMAELLVFLEDLADTIAQHLKIQSPTSAIRWGDFRTLASSLDRLESLIT
jgi:hypothetical protein